MRTPSSLSSSTPPGGKEDVRSSGHRFGELECGLAQPRSQRDRGFQAQSRNRRMARDCRNSLAARIADRYCDCDQADKKFLVVNTVALTADAIELCLEHSP
jgi:hypothetical protein